MIIYIAAYDQNRGIGWQGNWPRIAADRERFHKLISNKTIVMGSRTYDDYKAFKKFVDIKKAYVLSRKPGLLPDAEVINNLNDIIEIGKEGDVWVIGGGEVFRELLPYTDKLFLTEVKGVYEARASFPDIDPSEWNVVERKDFPADKNESTPPYIFLTLERRTT